MTQVANRRNCIVLIALILLVVTLPYAYAEATLSTSNPGVTELHDGYVFSGDSFEAGPLIIALSAGSNGEVAYLDAGQFAEFVRIGDCEYEDVYALCVDAIDTSDNRRRAYVRIFRLESSIAISKTFSDTTPYPGELISVTLDITSDGFLDVDSVLVEDTYPDVFEIERVLSPCKQSGTTIFYDGKLDAGDSVSCEYELRASDVVLFEFFTRVSYFNGILDLEEYLDGATLSVDELVDVTVAFNESTSDVKEHLEFKVTLTNDGVDEVTITDVEVLFPPELEVTIPHPTFTKINDGFYRRENIEVATSEEYAFIFYPKKSGEYDVVARGNYVDSDIIGSFEEKSNTLTTDLDDLELDADDETSTKESFEEETIRIWVENTNPSVKFVNLVASFEENDLIHVSDIVMPELNPTSSRKIVDIAFEAPSVNTSTTYSVVLNVSYETEFGEEGSETFTRTVTVEPITDIVIAQSFSDSSIEAGNTTQLIVQVTNDRDLDLRDVKVYDIVPGVEIIGQNSITFDVDAETEVEAYTYHLRAPEDIETTATFNVTTVVEYEREGHTFSTNKSATFTASSPTYTAPIEYNASITVDATIVDSSFVLRERFPVTYVIENEGEAPALHVTVNFPLQQEFDLIGPRSYFIPMLLPDEKLTLTDYVWYRPKLQDEHGLLGVEVTHTDERGKAYNVVSSNSTIDVESGHNFTSPALIITKSTPHITTVGTSNLVNLSIENIGATRATAKILDHDKEWDVAIAPFTTKIIQHRYTYRNAGKFNLSSAEALYSFNGIDYIAGSNSFEVVVNEAVEVDIPDAVEEVNTTSVDIDNEESPTLEGIKPDEPTEVVRPPQTETKKGVFARMKEYILAFFR